MSVSMRDGRAIVNVPSSLILRQTEAKLIRRRGVPF
jgi:hypothetical protein